MNEDLNTATLDAPIKRRDIKSAKPKRIPPYAVIIENDDFHTFPYVVELLQKVFGFSVEKAVTLTNKVDKEGEAHVWTGSKEVAELKYDQVRSVGPDLYAAVKVEFPLGCRIEPLR